MKARFAKDGVIGNLLIDKNGELTFWVGDSEHLRDIVDCRVSVFDNVLVAIGYQRKVTPKGKIIFEKVELWFITVFTD